MGNHTHIFVENDTPDFHFLIFIWERVPPGGSSFYFFQAKGVDQYTPYGFFSLVRVFLASGV